MCKGSLYTKTQVSTHSSAETLQSKVSHKDLSILPHLHWISLSINQDPLNSLISLATALSKSIELVSLGWDGRAGLLLHTSLPPPPCIPPLALPRSLSHSPLCKPGKCSTDFTVSELINALSGSVTPLFPQEAITVPFNYFGGRWGFHNMDSDEGWSSAAALKAAAQFQET